MFVIIGILVVVGGIVGGYLMEHGNLMVLMQPAELVIIGGAALGTVFIANPLGTIIRMGKGAIGVFLPSAFSKAFYLDHLKMLNELFQYARKHGAVKLESDIEEPKKSEVFKEVSQVPQQSPCTSLRLRHPADVHHRRRGLI